MYEVHFQEAFLTCKEWSPEGTTLQMKELIINARAVMIPKVGVIGKL